MDRWARFRGYEPHSGQIDFHADWHRHRTMPKGRRGGGTTAGSFEVEVEAQLWGGEVGDADIGILAPTAKKTELLFGMVHDSLVTQRRFNRSVIKKANFASGDRRIETTWGCRIFAWSLKEGLPGEGTGLRLLVVDESQELPWLVWFESLAPTLMDRGGRAVFIGKAKGAGFRKLSRMGLQFPRIWANHPFPSWRNPVVPREEIETWRAQMPAWLFGQECEAIFQDMGDRVFTGVEDIVDDELELGGERDPKSWYSAGWDLARKVDETVGITLDARQEPFPVVEIQAAKREPWPAVQARIERHHTKWGSEVWLDASGVGDAVAGNLGVPTSQLHEFIFTPKSKTPLITNLQAFIEHKRIRIPRHPTLIEQLEDYAWDDKGLETDYVMALALACWGIAEHKPVRIRWA